MSLCSHLTSHLHPNGVTPSGKMLGESLHPKSIGNQCCQILFHVKCFQFALASHQDIRMFLTGERSVKIMSGASSNSA